MMNQLVRIAVASASLTLAGCKPESSPPVAQEKPAETFPATATVSRGGSPLDAARAMRPLAETDGALAFPLASGPTGFWSPVRDGVTLTPGENGLGVRYTRTRGKAAGAAVVFKPGALTRETVMDLTLDSAATTSVNVCLTQEDGSVWSLGAARTTGRQVRVQLPVADAEWDPYQNSGRARRDFDPAKVYMVTLLDIGGFMGGAETDLAWTIASLRGVHK